MARNRLYGGAAISALAFGLTAPAAAQTAQDADGAVTQGATADASDQDGLEEIVVTAQKRSENVQDVPIAISAISSDYLESRDITSIDQLGSVAPNVKIERSPSNKTISQISIRGSVTINPSVLFEPAVGLYVDGVYIAKAQGSIFDIADLERVEVLRGPQGTLYGRNTLAGAINLVTRKPSGEFGGSAEITYGSFNLRRAKATIDLPAVGIFSAKVSGQIQKRDGFIDVVPNPFPEAVLAQPNSVSETNDLDNHSLLVQIRARPSADLTVDYAFDYSRYDQRPDYAQLFRVNRNGDPRDLFDPASPSYPFAGAFFPLNLYTNEDRQRTASIDADPLFEKLRTQGHALTIAYDIGDATLKSISAYRKLEFADSLDLDGTPLNVAFTQRFTEYDSFSQEFQLVGSALGDRLNYVVGAFYFVDKGETLGPQFFFGGGTAFQSDYGQHTEAYAAYAQADFKITDRLVLTGGIRYNHEEKDISRLLVIGAGTAMPTTLLDVRYGDIPDAKYNSVSPAATIRYEISDRINVYARYAKGFKSGGFNGETNEITAPTADCPSGAPELCNPYQPEKVDSFEVGFKSRLLDNKLQLNVSAFWDEHKQIQLSVFRGEGAASSAVLNAAAARIRGIEAEFTARPTRTVTINGSAAYLDPKYKEYLDAGIDVSNNRAFP